MKKVLVQIVLLCAPAILASAGQAGPEAPGSAGLGQNPPSATRSETKPDESFDGGKGRVLEAVHTSGYTYINVEIEGKSIWAAAPRCEVKNGDTVVLPAGDLVSGYHSSSLDRTFDRVYMVPCIEVVAP